jgi:hypothetical protein
MHANGALPAGKHAACANISSMNISACQVGITRPPLPVRSFGGDKVSHLGQPSPAAASAAA